MTLPPPPILPHSAAVFHRPVSHPHASLSHNSLGSLPSLFFSFYRWTNPDGTTSKIFGFVAKKLESPWENVCHLFAELDPDQPAGAIVTFITKVLLGQRK